MKTTTVPEIVVHTFIDASFGLTFFEKKNQCIDKSGYFPSIYRYSKWHINDSSTQHTKVFHQIGPAL